MLEYAFLSVRVAHVGMASNSRDTTAKVCSMVVGGYWLKFRSVKVW